jgi:prevent-host-death family protein
MNKKVSSTEAVRNLGELLAEVRHTGARVVITKNGNPIAKLEPVEAIESMRLREFLAEWTRNADSSFADDLEKVQEADEPEKSPWE